MGLVYQTYKDAMIKALVGEIYPQIDLIGIRWVEEKAEFSLRFYVDREPEEYDYESIGMVSTEFFSIVTGEEMDGIKTYKEEVVKKPSAYAEIADHAEFEIVYGRRNYKL